MRTLIALFIVVCAASSVVAQPTLITPPSTDQTAPYVLPKNVVYPFGTDNKGPYFGSKAIVVGDILTDGWVKDTTTLITTFYGKIWSLAQSDSMPTPILHGMDSVTCVISYRWVSITTGTWAAGPWTAYTGTLTMTTKRAPTSTGSGGGLDTLVIGTKTAIVPGPYARPQFVQFKYVFTSTRAVTGTTGHRQIVPAAISGRTDYNYTFLGAVDLVFRREVY